MKNIPKRKITETQLQRKIKRKYEISNFVMCAITMGLIYIAVFLTDNDVLRITNSLAALTFGSIFVKNCTPETYEILYEETRKIYEEFYEIVKDNEKV